MIHKTNISPTPLFSIETKNNRYENKNYKINFDECEDWSFQDISFKTLFL